MNNIIIQILSDPTYDPPEAALELNLSGDLLNILNQLPKEVCVAFAVGEAKLALPIFEAERPDDDRPRKAIEAVEEWLRAAASAVAVAAARAAAYSASDAAAAAYSASDAAAAAYYAASAAASAAAAADAAAYYAAAADAAAYSAAYYADAAAADAARAALGMLSSITKKNQFIRLFKLL